MQLWNEFENRLDRALDLHDEQILQRSKNTRSAAINYELERLRLKERALELEQVHRCPVPLCRCIEKRRNELNADYEVLQQEPAGSVHPVQPRQFHR